MITFYYGADGYRLNQAARELTRGLPSVSVGADGPESFALIENILKTRSLFNDKTTIVVRRATTSAKTSEQLATILKEQNVVERDDVTILVVGEEKWEPTKHKQLGILIKNKLADVKEFKPPAGAALVHWIMDEFKQRERAISPAAARRLAELTGPDTWALAQEIEKLSNYAQKEIMPAEVDLLVPDRREVGPFELADAVGERNIGRALALLTRELRRGRDAYNIWAVITSQFRTFLTIKDGSRQGLAAAELAATCGLHPFVVRKAVAAGRRFEFEEIKEKFSFLAELDRVVKDGRRILVDELFAFLLRLGKVANSIRS